MLNAALLILCAVSTMAGEVCKEPDTNKTLTCSGAKPDCCVGPRFGPASCYNKLQEECCQNLAHGVNQPCQRGKCLHGGARASERVACCSADTTPCSGYTIYSISTCIKAGQQCCGAPNMPSGYPKSGVGVCPAESVCCSPQYAGQHPSVTPTKCCPAGSTCCSSAGASSCCAPGEKCVVDLEHRWYPNSTKCVSTSPTFMAVV